MNTPPRNRISELDPIRGDLEKFVERNAEALGQSAISLNIFTDNYKKGIDSLLQFALCIMMDKPIFLLVPNGVTVPKHVEKIAEAIERFDYNDTVSMERAAKRLMQKASEKGFMA